jgi:hypothetical protein
MNKLDNKELSKRLTDNSSKKLDFKFVKTHASKKSLGKGNFEDGFILNKEGVKYFEKNSKPHNFSIGYDYNIVIYVKTKITHIKINSVKL